MKSKSKPAFNWDEEEIIKFGAHEFWKMPKRLAIGAKGDEEGYLLLPHHKPDSHLEFPGKPPLDGLGPWISSGVAVHTVGGDRGDVAIHMRRPWTEDDSDPFEEDERPDVPFATAIKPYEGPAKSVAAANLALFSEVDFYGECFQVLEANRWWTSGSLASQLVQQVESIVGSEKLNEARSAFDANEEFELYVLELAAKHLALPLSRIWYAASMMALYYLHHDDMRLGYLWAEYQMKMRFELFALKHMETAERNRASGMKGGQADKKRERYSVLDGLGKQRFKELAFASDRDGVRVAKRIAADYDRRAETPLFKVNGKDLSPNWYGDWLAHFRQLARGIE